jgi:hypothetical protein
MGVCFEWSKLAMCVGICVKGINYFFVVSVVYTGPQIWISKLFGLIQLF